MDTTLLHRIASVTAAATTPASVIYVAIGCAQGHYAPGEHSAQQYPPFLATWSPPDAGQHVILIDPALEDPPRCLADTAASRNITFYPIRTAFHWDSAEHRAFLTGLIRIATAAPTRKPTHLIVQDYTGHDIGEEYSQLLTTIASADPRQMLARVLFDPSYDGPGCFPSLTTPVLRNPVSRAGDFLQPAYTTLQQLVRSIPPPDRRTLAAQREFRSARIRYYAGRLLRNEFSERPDLAADALQRLQAFRPIVGYTPTADPTILRRLITDTLRDMGAIASPPRHYTDEAITSLLEDTRGSALNLEFHACCRDNGT